MDYQQLVGRTEPPYVAEVERGAIRRFAQAIGASGAQFHDPEAARALGYPDLVAPSTFPISLQPPVQAAWLQAVDRTKLLHGEQAFAYQRPPVAGDRITCRERVAEVYSRQGSGGPMHFIVSETEGRDAAGELVFTARRTLVIRG